MCYVGIEGGHHQRKPCKVENEKRNVQFKPGLTPLYRVFLIHFLFSSIYVFLMIFRPGWNGNVVKTTFDSPVGCFFMGLLLNLSVLAGWLLVTYFNFLKFDFYYTLMRDRLSFTRFVLRICLVFYLNSAIAFLIVEKHGPSHRYGYDNCDETNIHGRILYKFCTVILFVINGIMAYTFWKYRHWKHDAILNLDHQLMVNVYLSPFLFFGTILCTFLGLMWQKEGMYKKGTYISIHLFEHLIDCFMNSMLMYYYIFELINSEPQSNLGILQELSASSESDLYTETGPDHDPTFSYQWIALPGGHPILCTRAVIIAHGLHRFIVTKPNELHLIKLYQSRGHMQNLMQFCNTTDDLVTSLNGMGFQVPGAAAAPPPQRSVDLSMFYE